jgi:hypothetical protein
MYSSNSGGVASKSGAMQSFPFRRPGTRSFFFGAYFSKVTTGLPLRAITIFSPFDTRSMREDRLVFALCDYFGFIDPPISVMV